MIKKIITSIFVILLASCTTTDYISSNYQKEFNFSRIESLVILPFYFTSNDSISESTSAYYNGLYFYSGKTTETQGLDLSIPDYLSMKLFDTRLKLVDRTYIEKILEEQKLSLTGLMEQKKYGGIGELVSADVMLYGHIKLTRALSIRKFELTAKLIDVSTGMVIYSFIGEKGDMGAGISGGEVFKNEILDELSISLKELFM